MTRDEALIKATHKLARYQAIDIVNRRAPDETTSHRIHNMAAPTLAEVEAEIARLKLLPSDVTGERVELEEEE